MCLKVEWKRHKEYLSNTIERIDIFEASISKMVKLDEDMFYCSLPTNVYALFLKEQCHKFQLGRIAS